MSGIHIDKTMGGRARDKEESSIVVPNGEEVINITNQINQIAGDIVNIQDSITNITNNINNIEGDITQIQGDIVTINNVLTQIQGDIVTIQGDITNIEGDITNIQGAITNIQNTITNIQNTITNLENRITTIEGDITQIEGDIVTIQGDITNIKNDILTIQGDITNLQNLYTAIDARVTNIEGDITQIQGDIVTIQGDITNIKQDIITIQGDITNLDARVTNIEGDITQIEGDITQIQGDILTIQNLITNLDNRVTQIEGDITQIQGDITQIKNDITQIQGDIVTIQNLITNLDNRVTQIEGDITEIQGDITNLDNRVTNIEGDITDIQGDIIEIFNELKNGFETYLISGSLTWINLLNYSATALEYQILNRKYSSPAALLTIPANASELPMFAVIYADVFGKLGYILGTPAESPAVPHVDDSTQIALTTVLIGSLGTTPEPEEPEEEIKTVVIYDENTEWTTAGINETNGDTSVDIDFAATDEPAKGTKHILATFGGGTQTFERGPVTQGLAQNGKKTIVFAESFNTFSAEMGELWPNHKSDTTIGNVRHLFYYNWKNASQLQVRIKSKSTGLSYYVDLLNSTSEAWTVPSVNFGVNVPKTLNFKNSNSAGVGGFLPAGEYELILLYANYNDQVYYVTTDDIKLIEPLTAQMSFTNNLPDPASIKTGNLSFSIKTSVAWLVNTGFLIQLFKGTEKIGSLAFLPGQFYGFNPANLSYQRVTIPIEDFKPTATEITSIVIKPVNAWPNSVLYIDNITLQTGVIPPDELIQADWAQTNVNSPEFIKNKPTIPESLEQVASDWNQATPTSPDYIKNKPSLGSIASHDYWTGSAAAYAAVNPKLTNTIYFVEE